MNRLGGLALCAVLAVGVGACRDDGDDVPRVTAGAAYTAVIEWEIAEHPPIPDEEGNVALPVIYVTSGRGESIDAGTQASVVAATKDVAVVRFSDDRDDAIEVDVEGEPVKDDGVILLVDDVPEGRRTITIEVGRYKAIGDETSFEMTISATETGATVMSAVPQV